MSNSTKLVDKEEITIEDDGDESEGEEEGGIDAAADHGVSKYHVQFSCMKNLIIIINPHHNKDAGGEQETTM